MAVAGPVQQEKLWCAYGVISHDDQTAVYPLEACAVFLAADAMA